MLCRPIISVLSPLEKKIVPCDVTDADENDRATFTKSANDRNNGFITYTVKVIAIDMFEKFYPCDINDRLHQESIYPCFTVDGFDENLGK